MTSYHPAEADGERCDVTTIEAFQDWDLELPQANMTDSKFELEINNGFTPPYIKISMAEDVEPFAQIVNLKGSAISGSYDRIQYSVVRCGNEEFQPGETRDYVFAYGTGTERIMK